LVVHYKKSLNLNVEAFFVIVIFCTVSRCWTKDSDFKKSTSVKIYKKIKPDEFVKSRIRQVLCVNIKRQSKAFFEHRMMKSLRSADLQIGL